MRKPNKSMKQLVISSAFAATAMLAVPTVGEAALGDQTLKQGMNHNDVKELQDVLKGKGHFTYHTSTGYFGTITRDALLKFQREEKLPQTGVADSRTLQALTNQSTVKSKNSISTNQTLKNGSRGTQVSTLQQTLNDAGYHSGKVDGIFGKLTEQAVRNYQKAQGLTVDGLAGVKTLAALNGGGKSTSSGTKVSESSSSQTLKIGSRGTQVSTLQEALNDAGYHSGKVDGVFGKLTEQAVRNYQKAQGLTVDGLAGVKTLAALNSGASSGDKVSDSSSGSSSNSTTLRKGVRGQAVTDLQSNLKRLGFFSANATGLYGDITVQAVRDFQRKHGLAVDGIAGPKTLSKLTSLINGKNDQGAADTAGFNVMNLVADASEHIGVPYVWGGNTPQQGFDCSGFIVYAFNQQNVQLPRTVAQMWNVGQSVSKPQVGDIVFFATTSSSASHAGIYIGNNKFIQSGTSTGVTISDMNNSYWNPRYLGAKRLH